MRPAAVPRRSTGLVALVVLSMVGGALGIVVATASVAVACSCVALSDQEAFDDADVVFAGQWVETDPGPPAPFGDPDAGVRLGFTVDVVYAGEVYERQSVVTSPTSETCGLDLDHPGPFLVFARSESGPGDPPTVDGEVVTHLCSGTRALASGAAPEAFGPGYEPLSGSSPAGGGSPLRIVVAVGVGAALVVGIVALVRSRRGVAEGDDAPPSPRI